MCKKNADIPSGSVNAGADREVLPTNVKPLHYDLTLEPNFEKFSYEGTVVIDLDVKEDTTSISLNTLKVDIHSTKISASGNEVTSSPKLAYNEDNQMTTISFDKSLPAGSKAQLTHTFTGYLNDKMAGFYRSSYKDKEGKTQYIASTQMEPTDARRAFPCFDEPALKAEYTITLVAEKNLTCLSNMEVTSEKEIESTISGGKKKAVTFNKTPPMSTYLLAFIVGELNYIETKAFRVPIRVYATPDKDIEHGRFSVDLAAKTLAFYEKEFDNEFPLTKMDMVAVPDFSAGAMENWGLITYRVVDLLYDEQKSGASVKERIAEVVQHELAHQWFGNLVTMDFWDGLWLNEGFATWMSWYSCNKFYPEWKVWEGYVVGDLQNALSLDSLRSSHPIEVPVKRADEVNQIFDAISYSKGSCVIRMISQYLGEQTFMEGIRRYIKKHAYGNTKTEDLWAALSDASGKPVEKIMDIWTKKVGYPVVTVTENEDGKSIHVKQNRFLRTGDTKPEEDETLYPVFLGLKTSNGVNEGLTLFGREDDFEIPENDSFKLNADHSGIYRTSYTPERLEKLGQAAKEGHLSVEDRAGMIADAGALASSGYQKTSGILSLLKSFSGETEFVVWNELLTRISSIRSAWVFEDQKTQDALKAFQRALVSPKAHEKGWTFTPDEDHIQAQFKALLFGRAGLSGDTKIIKAAQDMFKEWAAGNRTAIHPNIRGGVYSIVLQNGGDKEYDTIFDEYKTAKDADERNSALRSLGNVKGEKLVHRSLALPLSDVVKGQDVYLPIAGLRSEKEGIEGLWSWMTENWEPINKKCPASLGMLSTIVQICTAGFTSEEQLEGGFDRALEQSSDAVRAKASWLQRDREDVESWLSDNGYLAKSGQKL
ncbi:Aminopeptidase 2 mitochondrial [Imshaugia aleurites]|uniref:Aminopeptidase n=1 Tax=Imshaugia aleurites TaxID=172621 RepID=A0A8H3F4M6_9LECA|nr:Aminopeptidase 2 mitochondrial [Imshaugia aleurites]